MKNLKNSSENVQTRKEKIKRKKKEGKKKRSGSLIRKPFSYTRRNLCHEVMKYSQEFRRPAFKSRLQILMTQKPRHHWTADQFSYNYFFITTILSAGLIKVSIFFFWLCFLPYVIKNIKTITIGQSQIKRVQNCCLGCF